MLYFGLADQVAGQPKALLLLEPPSFNPKCQEKFLCHKIYKGFNTLSHIIFTVSRIGELETASPILIFFIVVIIVVLLCGWAFFHGHTIRSRRGKSYHNRDRSKCFNKDFNLN